MAVRVYYLDDEVYLCDLFKRYFQDKGFSVSTFTDAQAAISACQSSPPDIIFIDYRLTGVTGLTVAQMIDKHIPKVLVTGELDPPDGNDFLKVISKPYLLKDILGLLQSHFNGPAK